jgi:hypothetical protein
MKGEMTQRYGSKSVDIAIREVEPLAACPSPTTIITTVGKTIITTIITTTVQPTQIDSIGGSGRWLTVTTTVLEPTTIGALRVLELSSLIYD